ncbi:hypothetical protein [Rhodococcus sp. NPDC004095]
MGSTVDPNSGDIARSPWLYPGARPTRSGLLHERGYDRLVPSAGSRLGRARVRSGADARSVTLEHALRASNAAGVDSRYLVVAVGCNASPEVVRRKCASADVDTTVPFFRATVDDLEVSHSAHVSRPGYVAATPTYRPGARAAVFVSLFDRAQLRCLDATESNYVRRLVPADKCRLTLQGRERPSAFLLYTSGWGALAPPGDLPLPLQTQEALFERLLRDCPDFAALVGDRPPCRRVMQFLAQDEELREAARAVLARWAVPGGFEDCPAGSTPRYRQLTSEWSDTTRAVDR